MAVRLPTDGFENSSQKVKQTPDELVGTMEGLTRLAWAPVVVILPSPMYKNVPVFKYV